MTALRIATNTDASARAAGPARSTLRAALPLATAVALTLSAHGALAAAPVTTTSATAVATTTATAADAAPPSSAAGAARGTAAAAKDASGGARRTRQLGQYSGFEGRELELGRAVAAALRGLRPNGAPAEGVDPRYDFSGREELLGLAMTQVVRTLNHNQSYQHEMNDALVKLTLDHIMFAKRNGMLRQMVEEDVNSQRQQLERVRRLIERGGSRDLALVAIFEQTACFFQLVDRTQRTPGRVAWRSPYQRVLKETVRMGLHDLTEKEIHEVWTVPRLEAYARIVGVELDIAPWREDGELSVSVRGGV